MKQNFGKAVTFAALAATLVIAACGGGGGGSSPTPAPTPTPTPSGALQTSIPAPTYAVGSAELAVFNIVNAHRDKCGFGLIAQSSQLDSAAGGHANYMRLRLNEGIVPGHDEDPAKSGFTAATGSERAQRAGFAGSSIGEYISFGGLEAGPVAGEELVRNMLASVYHAAGMLDGSRVVGVAVSYADAKSPLPFSALAWQPGLASGTVAQAPSEVVTFPCEGTTGVRPDMLGETPDPFTKIGLQAGPNIGQPVYVRAPSGTAIKLSAASIREVGGSTVTAVLYHSTDDPRGSLASNQAFVIPTQPLKAATSYEVSLTGTLGTQPWSRSFRFSTK